MAQTVSSSLTEQKQIFLPARLVGYIGSFVRSNYESNFLLNMYKAFEFITYEGDEDPLCYYKTDVQSYLAGLALDVVIFDEEDYNYGLTNREIMYIFDCYYCDQMVLIYGEEIYEAIGDVLVKNTEIMRHIDHEFLDCSEFTEERLEVPNMGIEYGLSDKMNIKMYKYIRLLEEAVRLKSTALIAYMKDKMVITSDMVLYIYIKHNHEVYAPDWYSLAADDLLLSLCKELGVLPVVLGMAINGKRLHYAGSEAALKNVVRYNLEVVKKIVPDHISPDSRVIPYEVNYDDYEGDQRFFDILLPYEYWQMTYKEEVEIFILGEPNRKIEVVGCKEAGDYLCQFELK